MTPRNYCWFCQDDNVTNSSFLNLNTPDKKKANWMVSEDWATISKPSQPGSTTSPVPCVTIITVYAQPACLLYLKLLTFITYCLCKSCSQGTVFISWNICLSHCDLHVSPAVTSLCPFPSKESGHHLTPTFCYLLLLHNLFSYCFPTHLSRRLSSSSL